MGGKRLRPSLVLLSSHTCAADREVALLAAAGVEMLHTATLVHDDLIDNALIRRGIATLNATWPPTATVLAGDILFALAAKMVARTGSNALVRRFAETLEAICAGELSQLFDRDGGIPTVPGYYERIYAKTGSLFALCTESGPLLAGCAEDVTARARAVGQLLGKAYQITDDVLDLVGTTTRLGKPAGTDLRQGIITLPMILYAESNPSDSRLHAVAAREADEAALSSLVNDVRVSDAPDEAMSIARSHVEEALALLESFPATPHRRAFAEILRFGVQRRF
jgi:geranylgeranyl pyrophosphate synthase